jgi:hypothetical protein
MKIEAKPPGSKKFDYVKSPLKRVSSKHKCEICGKPDWCSYSEDGALALCMRERAGRVKEADNGASVHVLRPNYLDRSPAKSATPIRGGGGGGSKIVEKADEERRHSVYYFLLEECLTLNSKHGDQLLNERRLSDATIAANLYASMPGEDSLPDVCGKLRERFGEGLKGVPGFYRDEAGRWKMLHIGGLMIPVRDVRGRIAGLQIRPDVMLESKYIWFSTNPDKDKYADGASSGAPLHFVKPDLAGSSGFAFITEGALKADIISEISECAVVGIAGATTFNAETFGAELLKSVPELRRVAVALDSDWRTKKSVRGGLKRLLLAFEKTKLKVTVLDWDADHGKGLDDYMIAALGLAA